MTYCEDAPCCGCCGTSVYGPSDAAYDAYAEDYYRDPYEDDFDPFGDDLDDEPFVQEDDTYYVPEDAMMESMLFGDC